MPNKYKVTVIRTAKVSATFTVTANTSAQARVFALDEASDFDYSNGSEIDAEYTVEEVERVGADAPRDPFDPSDLPREQRGPRRLVSFEEAACTDKQPVKPCSDCPWARASLPGWLGDLTPLDWIKTASSEAIVLCHALKDAHGKHHQCAGLAIYRKNVGKLVRDPEAIVLEKDKVLVFSTPMEFMAHHESKPTAKPRRKHGTR